jgi:diguanylate cyclase (GGDEF)-like protein
VAADGWRAPTVRLISVGLVGFLLGDTAWAVVNQNNWNVSSAVAAGLGDLFVIAYALLGAAALHPATNELVASGREREERMSRALLASLTVASLVAPVILLREALTGTVRDGVAIAIGSAQLTGLVIARTQHLLRHVQRQSQRLRDLALEDPLTGLPNRRALGTYLATALPRARRDAQPICLALLDLDRFKHFNDDYGHAAGDHLLKSAAGAWAQQVRASDMLARVGGEEFVLVLPSADAAAAEAVIDALRDLTPLGQTFSAGLCQWDREMLPEELLEMADIAMYRAKRAGGNRTERAVPAEPSQFSEPSAA